MISYANACAAVGYDPHAERPAPEYQYYAYKAGQAVAFKDRDQAMKYSRNVERVAVNQNEIDAFRDNQRKLEQQAAKHWYDELRSDFQDLSDKQFALVYARAYEECHSSGYDDIADEVDTLVDLCRAFANA